MKQVLASIIDDNYVEYLLVLMYSLIKHNPDILKLEFRLIHDNDWVQLSEGNKKKVQKLWPNTKFYLVDNRPYRDIEYKNAANCYRAQNVSRKNDNCARAWFLKFAMLKWKDVDKVIYMDSDMLCVFRIDKLLDIYPPFGVRVKTRSVGKYIIKRGQAINAGLLVIGKDIMQETVHDDLVNLANNDYKNGDQGAWREYFRNRKVFVLGKRWNQNPKVVRQTNDLFKFKKATRIIHFWGAKPKERKKENLRPADKLWFKYRKEMVEKAK